MVVKMNSLRFKSREARVERQEGRSCKAIDVDDGTEHKEGNDDEGYLEPLLQLAAEDDGIEAALLKA